MVNFRFTIILLIIINCLSYSQDESDFSDFIINDVSIEFITGNSFESKEIISILQTPKSEYFDSKEIERDIRRIDKFYFDNGFFDVRIDTSLMFNKSEKKAEIVFRIKENKPYFVNNIDYKGLDDIYFEARKDIFESNLPFIKKGMRYSKDMLLKEISRVIEMLNNNGYANALSFAPEVDKFISSDTSKLKIVNLNLNFIPGDFYRFGITIINIEDNPQKYGVEEIVKELEYKENDIYSKKVLIESENRLARISIIENARIQINNIDTITQRINLMVTGSLTNKYELEPELVGYDITNRFFAGAGISFTDKYFLRGGRRFTGKITGLVHSEEVYLLELSAQLNQPYIFNNNKITGNLALSATFLKDGLFNISSVENIIGINYEFPRYTYINNLYLDWTIRNERFTFNFPIPEGSYTSIPEFIINLFTSTLGITTVHNNTDNFIFPTSGNYQSYLIEESGLISSLIEKIFSTSTFKYLKLMNVSKFYINIVPGDATSVLASKFLIGSIFEYGPNTLKISGFDIETGINIIPIEARFIAGGSISVRGWGAKKLGTFPNKENGGNFIMEGSFEHRTRPFYHSEGLFKNLGFVTFVDFGNLWEKPSKFRLSDIAIAIGAGIRYYTIIGPVRFDIGFKFYDYEADGINSKKWLFENSFSSIFTDKIAFQFGIGHTF